MTALVPTIDITAKGLQTRLPEGTFASNQTMLLGAGVVAVGVSILAIFLGSDAQNFLASYLVAYMFALTLCVLVLLPLGSDVESPRTKKPPSAAMRTPAAESSP